MAAVLRDEPAPVTQYQSALPESAKTTLDRMLAKEPDRRPQSVEEGRAELLRLTTEVSGVTPASAAPTALGSYPSAGLKSRPTEPGW